MFELACGPLLVAVDPAMGGAIRSFDLIGTPGRVPVLSAASPVPQDAGQSALFPMAPFANRVPGNRLRIGGKVRALEPNSPDPLCLHGWAWQRAWSVINLTPTECRMELRLRDHGMDLCLIYGLTLTDSTLSLSLRASNVGTGPCPGGLGFHPYFPRRADTALRFKAEDLWPEGPGHLPRQQTEVPASEDYAEARVLPANWRNQCYSRWEGTASVSQPSLGYNLEIAAPNAEALMFYADPALARFALEPQTHVSGQTKPGPHGLGMLQAGQDVRLDMTLSVRATGTPRPSKAGSCM